MEPLDDEHEAMERSSFLRSEQFNPPEMYLNTKSCCFFCLRVTTENEDNFQESLQYLCQHLNVNFSVNGASSSRKNLIVVNSLCEPCQKVSKHFTKLFLRLEKIQMEIDSLVERINGKMCEAYKNPELVKRYSQKMTSDKESLAQLVVVDKIRKEIASKSSKVRLYPHQLKVHLQKLSDPVFKREQKKLLNYQNSHLQILMKVEQPSPISSIMAIDNADYFSEEEMTPCNSPPPPLPPSPSNRIPTTPSPSSSMVRKTSKKKKQQVPGEAVFGQHFTKNLKTMKFDCSTCHREFVTRDGARVHCNTAHLGQGLVCKICNSVFGKTYSFKRHVESCSGVDKKNKKRKLKFIFNRETGTYNCPLCSKAFTSYWNCYGHFNFIHEKKRYKCDVCNIAEYKFPNSLKEHKKFCNKKTLQQRLIKEKRRKLDPKLKFSCKFKFCGIKFVSANLALRHERSVHLNEFDYPCDLCGKKYKGNSALKAHKDSFHLGKRFPCGTCKKQFVTGDSLRWHQKHKRCFKKNRNESNKIKREKESSCNNEKAKSVKINKNEGNISSEEPILLGVSFVKIEQQQPESAT